MNLLLDTSAFLYWSRADSLIPAVWVETIVDPANTVFISAVSAWEIAIKRKVGKLVFDGSTTHAATFHGFTWIDITPVEAEAAGDLDWTHRDPFDRMLVAQAAHRRLVLVTSDAALKTAPGVRTL